jgi:cell division protein FtsI/penicillin-binding protein 2
MLLRGRITVAALIALSLGASYGMLRSCAPEERAAVTLAATLPPVASPPPPVVPLQLLLDPPVSKGALNGPASVSAPDDRGDLTGPLRVEYTLDGDLTRSIWKILERGRVALGHVVVMDPESGELLAYLSTDVERFPPTRSYPAASLVKVITMAAALDIAPEAVARPCRYVGNKYRLTPKRVDPPRRGHEVPLRRALVTSNNQCFAQLAVHAVGGPNLLSAIDRFGWREVPGPGHQRGVVDDPGDDSYALGRLGSGLDGARITPLHAVSLAAALADGWRVEPRWIRRVTDATGRVLALPDSSPRQRVMTSGLAGELREMLAETTVRGTARRAFRDRRGRPLLQTVKVAGKTGSLSGEDPDGRYEWFVGVAPVDRPSIAIAAVSVQAPLYWVSASQVAAETLKVIFCPKGVCSPAAAARWRGASDAPEAVVENPGAAR